MKIEHNSIIGYIICGPMASLSTLFPFVLCCRFVVKDFNPIYEHVAYRHTPPYTTYHTTNHTLTILSKCVPWGVTLDILEL